MSEVARIQDQMRRAFDGEPWHGTPLRELVADLTASDASARPISTSHTIWELVLHIITWREVVAGRIGGEPVRRLPASQDWKPMPEPREAAWRRTLAALDHSQERLLAAVGTLTDAGLTDTVPGAPYDFYVMLHGLLQHDLYHAGQIALIRTGTLKRAA